MVDVGTSTKNKPSGRRVYNRVGAIMQHIPWYSFKRQSRLAHDAGVSESSISRLLRGKVDPSFFLMTAVTKALESRLRQTLDPREIISYDGTFTTPSVCDLVGCKGCLPEQVYELDDTLKLEFRNIKPGRWSALPEIQLLAEPTQATATNQITQQTKEALW
jgi:transcriptional regulator with XRE-family HTH domain